jgi:hypothetical protein
MRLFFKRFPPILGHKIREHSVEDGCDQNCFHAHSDSQGGEADSDPTHLVRNAPYLYGREVLVGVQVCHFLWASLVANGESGT